MGVIGRDHAIHFFTSDGKFLGLEMRKLTLPPAKPNGIYVFDDVTKTSLVRDNAKWTKELGFTESAIQVCKFESDGGTIEDLPSDLMELNGT